MITPYEQLIPRLERDVFERALGMESGYVLSFSDRTFDDFFFENLKIDCSADTRLFNGRGTSKAKRLRSFIEKAQPHMVAKALRHLWEYREADLDTPNPAAEEKIKSSYFAIVARFEGRSDHIDSTAIEAFEPDETLEELVASIRRDIDAKKPQAALDHLHTYCMKRFASLVRKHGGSECGKNEPLHSRVAKYVAITKRKHNLTPMSERILHAAIANFEEMNPIRNDQSLAHDNKTLVGVDEARFIFDSVTAFLRFSKSIDGQIFED